jgi:glycosyltransferase involved in cell wall biosynthesis
VKVFGWQADTQGCGWYRIGLPFDELAKRGHDATYATLMPAWVREGEADVVVAQRTCEPGPSGIWQRLAREGKSRLIFEVDDDLWNVDPSNRPAFAFYDADRRRRLIENVTVADAVTVTTEPLAEIVSQWNPHVHVVPNAVPAWLLDHEHPTTDRMTFGWRGGVSHSRDIGEMAKPVRSFMQRNADNTELHMIGHDFTERVTSRRGRIRHTDWLLDVRDFLKAIDFDAGLIPLWGSTFNESKSDVALVEYSALGIPAIASGIGPYRRAAQEGSPVLLAANHKEWTQYLTMLVNESETRAQLGKQAKEWAGGRTIEANAHLWEQAYAKE